MRYAIWLVAITALGALGYAIWSWRKRLLERQRASEARFATFIAQAQPAAAPASQVCAPDPELPKQKLLLDAGAKAAEAGEPALAIQLYARLLSRFPQSGFAAQARAAAEAQKRKLAKP